MATITLVRSDKNYYLEFEIRDADGEIVDITDCTVKFSVQKYGASTLEIDHKEGSIIIGTLGLCQVFIAEEFSQSSDYGKYYGELQIEFPGSPVKILTVPNLVVEVLKDLPR